jgi:NADH-quinone oxidoreductase subunit L
MFRLVYLTFYGKERMDNHTREHLHESPKSMTVPLMALAVLSIIGGWIGMPHIFGATNYFEHWLEPVMATSIHEASEHALASVSGDTGMEWLLMILSVALVIVAIFLAYLFYNKRTQLATAWQQRLSGVHRTLLNKYYVDEIYGAIVVRPLIYLSLFLWKFVDVILIDGSINGSSTVYNDISEVMRLSQSGRLRTYATIFLGGVVILVGLFVWGR